MALPVPRLDITEETSESDAFITSGLSELFQHIKKLAKDAPTIVYYKDLMNLLEQSNIPATMKSIISSLDDLKKQGHNVVLVAPNTPTFPIELADSSSESSVMMDLMSQLRSKLKSQMDGAASPQTTKEGLDYSTSVDEYLGVSVVNVYPPTEKQDALDFKRRTEEDLKILYKSANLKELQIVTRSCGVMLDKDIQLPSSTILEESLLSIVDIEKLAMLSLEEESKTITSSSLAQAAHSLTEYNHQENLLASSGPSSYTHLFHDPKSASSLSAAEKNILKACLMTNKTSSVQIGGLENVRRIVREVIHLPLSQPQLFQKGILSQSTTGILLFGPPGTGKTLLARSVASESGANFLNVQMSHISSKWVGENEKNVRALFSVAKKLKPCIIFVDEIDALLRARSRHQPSWGTFLGLTILVTNTINEFMACWDGIQSESSGVIVVGATNRPFDLDDAVLRRLPRRILVNFPNLRERKDILSVLLKDDAIQKGLIDAVAEMTDGHSGSDLKNLCIAAALTSIREMVDKSSERLLSIGHFKTAIEAGDVIPSMHERADLLKELDDWDRIYGTKAAGYNRNTHKWGFKAS